MTAAASTDHQDVVDRLRDKIRHNALDLLSRVDAATAASRGGGDRAKKQDLPMNQPTKLDALSINDTLPYNDDEEEKKDGSDPFLTPLTIDPTKLKPSPRDNHKAMTTPTELTKRLQQLALQRQQNLNNQQKHVSSSLSSSSSPSSLNNVIQSEHAHLSSAQTFDELMLPPHLLQSVYEMGFNRPSAIQSATLPLIFNKRNVIAQAQSGSGKTVTFTLGVLFHMNTQQMQTQAIIITPTRELAIQVAEQAIVPLSSHMPNLTYQLALSGCHVDTKVKAHVVVGTAGKITDWLKRKLLDARTVRVFVLDEADSMVDGFRAKTLLIYKTLPTTVQCLFFSATFPPLVVDFAAKLVKDPDLVLIDNDEELVLDVIKQLYVDTRQYPGGKIVFLADIYTLMTIGQSIVFVETRAEADQVHATLSGAGYSVSVLHSNLDADERDATMLDFRQGKSSVLITTNVLARGANVDNVCLVVNYGIPVDRNGFGDCETYLHRIGRTGRFGRKGTAINFIDGDSAMLALEQIRDHFGATLTQVDADPEALANEIQI